MKKGDSSSTAVTLCLLISFALQASFTLAQNKMSAEEAAIYNEMIKSMGMDPSALAEAMEATESAQFWTSAEVVHYHIVGDYQGTPYITSEPGQGAALASVTDRVVIDMDWKLTEGRLVGIPTFQNTKSVVTNPRDPEPACLPPVVRGEYEHFELLEVKDGLGGAIELNVQTTFPVVDVAQVCTGGRKSVPAGRDTRPEQLFVPSPMLLGTSPQASDNITISPDKKSMTHKKGGWAWTFTPSILE